MQFVGRLANRFPLPAGLGGRTTPEGHWVSCGPQSGLSELAETHVAHGVVGVLAEYKGRAASGGLDVDVEVRIVDRVPDALRLLDGRILAEMGIALEVRLGVAECCLPQSQEPLGV